jgi:hypothetical protein
MKLSRLHFRTTLSIVAIAGLFAACGSPPGTGGGGGGDRSANDPGDISLSVEKHDMDSGDFNRIHVDLFDINESGIILKFRYPSSIKYSKGSAVLFPGESEEFAITPYTEATSGKDRYLVFFISSDMAFGHGDLPLELDLKAITQDEEAFVEADLDNNDPRIDDNDEFRVSTPKFTAREHEDIFIRDENSSKPSGSATATPTPSA